MANIKSAAALLDRECLLKKDLLEFAGTGFPQGAISEVLGSTSAGRSGVLHTTLAAATQRGEACALVDWSGCFDPASAETNGVHLANLLWVRAHRRLDHAMTSTDWILHAGGFGVVALDLCETPQEELRRIPISWWHRFRLTVQNTPSILLIVADRPIAGSCPAASLTVQRTRIIWSGSRHLPCLTGFEIMQQLQSRKPMERATRIVEADWIGTSK
jgi:hypothetical protein